MCGESRHGILVICPGTTGITFLRCFRMYMPNFTVTLYLRFLLSFDISMNWVIRWVALLAFGEGWHNNHHAFEYSARHGLEWWQVDMTWYAVRFFQAIGLATDVKLPSEAQKQRMAFDTGGIATWINSVASHFSWWFSNYTIWVPVFGSIVILWSCIMAH